MVSVTDTEGWVYSIIPIEKAARKQRRNSTSSKTAWHGGYTSSSRVELGTFVNMHGGFTPS